MAWQRGGGQLRKPDIAGRMAGGMDVAAACRYVCAPAPMRTIMLKLYYVPGTCALASHIALEEAGAGYTTERLDFKTNQQQSPQYLAVNPKGRVPALVTDHGTLTETPAILGFIAQSFPQAKLAPFEDPFALAQLQSFNNYLCSTVHVAHAHKGRGYRWASDEASFADMKRKVPETMAASFALIERGMLKGPWVMGETYTVCDPYLFTLTRWLEGDSVDLATLPKVADHHKRMTQRPAVQKVLAEETA
jgi:glutathione S-transferase